MGQHITGFSAGFSKLHSEQTVLDVWPEQAELNFETRSFKCFLLGVFLGFKSPAICSIIVLLDYFY